MQIGCKRVETICNPVRQAMVLNDLDTSLNIITGLCIGHDTLSAKYLSAPVITFIVKDRVTCLNPAVVHYSGYFR